MAAELESIPQPEEHDASLRGGYQPTLDAPIDEQPSKGVFHAVHTVSGPMPSANELAGYKAVEPELPMLIFQMAKDEQAHRHLMETNEIQLDAAATKRGQVLGASVALAVLVLSGLVAILGFPTLAGIMAGIDVVGLAAVFVGTKIVQKRNDSSE